MNGSLGRSGSVRHRGRRAVGLLVAGLTLVLCTQAVWAASIGGQGSGPSIYPYSGRAFVPKLGDWEGTANGFPASFSLRLVKRGSQRGYGLNNIVALRPSTCPIMSYNYVEAVIRSTRSSVVGRAGALGLSGVGFQGSIVGRRAAMMSARYRAKSCAGRLRWHLRPANRAPVRSGTWSIRFGDGETGTFHVITGGRLATSIELPHAVSRCNGAIGAVDLFIRPSGLASLSGPDVRAAIRFSDTTAKGKMNAGGHGCPAGPVALSARLK